MALTCTFSLSNFVLFLTSASSLSTTPLVSLPLSAHAATQSLHAALRPWLSMHAHPGVVALRRLVSTADFGDAGSLCFVSDFYAGAQTLQQKYFAQPVRSLTGVYLPFLISTFESLLHHSHISISVSGFFRFPISQKCLASVFLASFSS